LLFVVAAVVDHSVRKGASNGATADSSNDATKIEVLIAVCGGTAIVVVAVWCQCAVVATAIVFVI
jgi:hypothetical protein